ncbi:unnamed protein product [Caenorhabditis angaria]|uniref:Uncharacterized protein n=1 Tax=Caenorhabditis angaria TaxID=860376 RepID=A0A9P1MWP3_9PELO|nr:unnamed protein product [Caenorhabditis angaria]
MMVSFVFFVLLVISSVFCDQTFDRQDRDYRPLQFGKRDYRPLQFGKREYRPLQFGKREYRPLQFGKRSSLIVEPIYE